MKRWDGRGWKGEAPEVVRQLASVYEIQLCPFHSRLRDLRRGISFGPGGDYAFHLAKRIVFLPQEPEINKALHEIVHVIVQPPWWDTYDVPEDLFLLQFERALARTILGPRAFAAVIAWQEVTDSQFLRDELEFVPNYERSIVWRRGFQLCRTLDLLDARNRPTFRGPRWEAIESRRDTILGYCNRGEVLPAELVA